MYVKIIVFIPEEIHNYVYSSTRGGINFESINESKTLIVNIIQ